MVQKYSLGIEAVDTHENTASILGEKIVTKSTGEAIGDMLSTNEQLARKVGLKAISSGTNIELSYKDPEILQCVTSSGETKSLVLNESTEHHQFSHATTPSLTGQIPLENTSSVVDKDARSVRSILPPIKTELEPAYNLPMYSPAFTTEDITQLTGGSRKPQPRDVIPQPISIKTDGLGPEPGLGARETNTANIRTGSCITPASLAYPVSAHISSSIEDMISVKLSNLYTPAQLLNFNDPRINLTSISAYPHNSIISTDVSPEATRAQTPAPNPLPLQHLSGVLANAVALPSVSASTSTDPAALSNHINPTSENIDNVITGLDVDTTTLPQPPNNGKDNKNDNSTQYSGLHNLLLKKHLS
ncbi:hypothetical protein AX774_g2670 [Zancudomyces culisetae]|uniref:Uncharacterized protein n=1 Tax=Zancudomyces culisetae TaxID=1213189 RepID=A0A1R1PS59_ZANCU|nr:hypothetical protein AX774_g2670 [Zancudomyces culisetae]|eukprot:OMH83820.1 hypothetical protein AX774_g2670 [Zancudomyces culisetae]